MMRWCKQPFPDFRRTCLTRLTLSHFPFRHAQSQTLSFSTAVYLRYRDVVSKLQAASEASAHVDGAKEGALEEISNMVSANLELKNSLVLLLTFFSCLAALHSFFFFQSCMASLPVPFSTLSLSLTPVNSNQQVKQMNDALKERKAVLAPQIKKLREVRKEFEEVEAEYGRKKSTYDKVFACELSL